MSRRRIFAITRRLLAQFRRDRRTIALLFAVPIVILGLLYLLLRGGGTPPQVGVVNEDQGPLGAAIAAQLAASPAIHVERLDRSAAEARLRDETLAGYVVFPTGFSALALQQHVIRPEVHLEGSEPGPASTVLQSVNQALVTAGTRLPGQPAPIRLDVQVSRLYGGPGLGTLDYFGGAFIGLVVFFLVFVITCVAFLRERSQGTLERLMASPLRRGEIVVGYMLGFTLLALLQSAEVLVFSLAVLRIYNAGNVVLIFGIEALLAVAAVNLGIFLSVFARSEFQAVQFIPLVIVPQVLLSGIIFPVSSEPGGLQAISNVLPLTYAVYALRDVMLKGASLGWTGVQVDAAVVLGFCALMVLAATATLRRRVA